MSVVARGWGWRWNGRRAWAVRGLDLRIEDGERVLLLGPSGAGKSTVLSAVAGLLDDGPAAGTGESQGELLVDGVPAALARLQAVATGAGRARAGLLLQDPQAQTILARCGDDVAFGLENHAVPRDQIWPRVDAALAAVDLPVPRSHSTSRLSGGQRQRLALAGVLALAPGLLLLDEPTAMLDGEGADRLRTVIGEQLAATGAGMLLIEHRIVPWLPLVDRVVVLSAQGILADGPPESVLADRAGELAAAGVWLPGRSLVARASTPCAPGGGEELLALDDVSAGHPGQPPVLTGVSAVVRTGRAIAVRGPNGAGKSTLALVMAGLTAPVAGAVAAGRALRVAGGAAHREVGPDPLRWRPRELVARIGSVFQDPRHQFVATTVDAELAVGPHRAGLSAREVAARVGELLERLDLAGLAQANPFTLSGGQARRLSVGTALATRPRMLVLDEPTFGQDATTWAEVVALLAQARDEGCGLVIATHDDDLAAGVGDETWVVAGGRVVAGGITDPVHPPVSGPLR